MARLVRFLAATAAACITASAQAAEDRWTFDFGQGVAEYAVGSFAPGGNHLALSCAEAGVRPGSASVSVVRAGFTPAKPTDATFVTDRGKVTLRLDAQGRADFASGAAAPKFRTLWRHLASARSLRVAYGPGEPMQFPTSGAAKLLGTSVCPKQLAQ